MEKRVFGDGEEKHLSISYNLVTVQEAVYLLCNNTGYMDADKKCINLKTKNVRNVENL
jgi:hypothetical protein